MFYVIRFERSIVRLVKMDQNRHHLAWAQVTCSLSLLATLHLDRFPLWLKAQHEIIDITEQCE
jgi:hypothetical protein